MMMAEPIVSKNFDVEDIRKIREYNFRCHIKMTPEEIIVDTKKEQRESWNCFRRKRVINIIQRE